MFLLCNIPPSLRNVDQFNQIFEFLKREEEFLLVFSESVAIALTGVNTSYGPLDGVRYNGRRFQSNCNRFFDQFEDFLGDLIDKSEGKSGEKLNPPFKLDTIARNPVEEIPRIGYEEIERYFIGDKKDAPKEELCFLSTFKETFRIEKYSKVETIFKNTLKIMESKEEIVNRCEEYFMVNLWKLFLILFLKNFEIIIKKVIIFPLYFLIIIRQ